MTSHRLYRLVFLISSLLYLLTSYLLLLRDAFILERVAFELNLPDIETVGLALAKILRVNYTATFTLLLSFVGLFLSFFFLTKQKTSLSKKFVLLVAFIYLLSFPILSNDVWDYSNSNRIDLIHHHNRWIAKAEDFPQDSSLYLGNWRFRPSVYFSVVHAGFYLIGAIFGTNPLAFAVGMKLLNLSIIGAISFFLKKIANTDYIYFFLNPLILIEFLGNAHNDLFVGLFSLLTLLYLSKKPHISAVSLAASFLSKITGVILLPFIFLNDFNQPKKMIHFLTVFLVASLILALPMITSFDSIKTTILDQSNQHLRSLPFILGQTLNLFFSESFSTRATKIISLALFFVAFIIIYRKNKNLYTRAYLYFLSFLLLASPMLQPWYLAWFLPITPLISSKKLKNSIILLSFGSMLHYIVLFISFYFHPFNFSWQIIMYLCFLVPPFFALLKPRKWYTQI